VEAVDAVHDHRLRLRQLAHPFLHPVRVAPGRADGDVLDARDGVLRAGVDELQWLAGVQHRPHFFDVDARQVAELLLHQRPRRRDLERVLVAVLHRLPVDVAHEGVDIGPMVGAEIDVIRVLVRVEREDRNPACDRLGVLRGELVDEPAVARDVDQHDPARSAAQGVAHCHELVAPALDRAEVARQRLRERRLRLAIAAEAREVELVQQRRVERDQLLALEAVDHVAGRLREVQRSELLADGVQLAQRAAVVVLVVALEQLLREAEKQPGPAVDLLQLVAHAFLL
jgi:hypothetical protein